MESISRAEKWRKDYLGRRYLEHIEFEQLLQRLRDIVCNLTILNDEGKIAMRAPEEGGGEWIERFTHVQEEHRLRGIDFAPGFMKRAQIPHPTYPCRPKSAEIVKGKPLQPGKFLIKYGKQKYLKDGSIRISAASSWLKSDNLAVQDNELEKSFFAHPGDVRIEVLKSKNMPDGHRIEPIGNITFTHDARADYYALCLSHVYDHRLFDDFDADCCLIVYDVILFGKRLEAAMRKRLRDWAMLSSAIKYYDPFNAKRNEVNAYWSKDFRFWYQQEFRFAWIQPEITTANLAPIDIVIGPIEDFGELICLV